MLLGVGTLLMLVGMMSLNMAGNLIITKFIRCFSNSSSNDDSDGLDRLSQYDKPYRDLRVFLRTK